MTTFFVSGNPTGHTGICINCGGCGRHKSDETEMLLPSTFGERVYPEGDMPVPEVIPNLGEVKPSGFLFPRPVAEAISAAVANAVTDAVASEDEILLPLDAQRLMNQEQEKKPQQSNEEEVLMPGPLSQA